MSCRADGFAPENSDLPHEIHSLHVKYRLQILQNIILLHFLYFLCLLQILHPLLLSNNFIISTDNQICMSFLVHSLIQLLDLRCMMKNTNKMMHIEIFRIVYLSPLLSLCSNNILQSLNFNYMKYRNVRLRRLHATNLSRRKQYNQND